MFIRIDDVVLNTEIIECVLPNKVVTKRGGDYYLEVVQDILKGVV